MGLRVHVFFSGSSGNATLISDGESHALIDLGGGCYNEVAPALKSELGGQALSAILVTHGHSDHFCKEAGSLAQSHACQIWSHAETKDSRGKLPEGCFTDHQGLPFTVGTLRVLPIQVSHGDQRIKSCYGFVLAAPDDDQVALITDVGLSPIQHLASLERVRHLLIESNYDQTLREQMNRPNRDWVLSDKGHLANHDSATFVVQLHQHQARKGSPALKQVTLAHLSEECNTPALALEAHRVAQAAAGVTGLGMDVGKRK